MEISRQKKSATNAEVGLFYRYRKKHKIHVWQNSFVYSILGSFHMGLHVPPYRHVVTEIHTDILFSKRYFRYNFVRYFRIN